MSELKPCPFCGGEAFVNDDPTGNGGKPHMSGNVGLGRLWSVECDECGADAGFWQDRNVAIAAWNSRAERVTDDEWESYQHSIPATEENMAKFGWVRERTCRNLDKHYSIMFKCSECGHWECQDFDGEKILPQTWNYCPNCGAKVRNE